MKVSLGTMIDKILKNLLKNICVILSITVALLMFIEVVARYVFTHAFRGLPEIYLLLVMWQYMIGAGLASANKSHLRIGIISKMIKSSQANSAYHIFIAGITLIISGFFLFWSFGLIQWAINRPQTTPILRMPWITSQASIMVASLLVAVYAFRDFLKSLKEFKFSKGNTLIEEED